MNILSYVQARNEIVQEMNEENVRRVLTISGRASEWTPAIAKLISEKGEAVNNIDIVEQTGMGRAVLQIATGDEWVYLVNPSMAPADSRVVKEGIVNMGKLFSPAVFEWILAQEIGAIYRLSERELTTDEAKVMRLLWDKQESVCEREEIAISLWGESWSEKYSDWGIDALMSRLRKKISGNWQIVTIKGRGYMLASSSKPSKAPQTALSRGELVEEIAGSIYPSDEYLRYMNDQTRVRKVYKDLFEATKRENILTEEQTNLPSRQAGKLTNIKILCVNSYSFDNVDSILAWVKKNGWKGTRVYFAHYDPRSVEMHQDRIKELGVGSFVESHYDDLRESKLKDVTFDLVINDFRLNFNQNDAQNKTMMRHVYRVLKNGGLALVSTVVDGKYENMHYGVDQEKAPINAGKPGTFQADEHLIRRCWSVPYWRQLWGKTGFDEVKEFDIEEGKRWGIQPTLTTNPWSGPFYRRWLLCK